MQAFKQREKVKLSDLDARFPDHVWVFWSSPTSAVFAALLLPYTTEDRRGQMSADDLQHADDEFLSAVSELVLDTGGTLDLAGNPLDLSTLDRARAAFLSQDVDAELLSGIIMAYVMRLVERRQALEKKVVERSDGSHGGTASDEKAVPSLMPS